ncbi:MAG TPA: NHL repeat-containing protein [Ferruginibacter sp.]|jgi:sugar lactone lactonase YvrE|nr:NHL repeat-containing protein [Ferruginibacter sp.]
MKKLTLAFFIVVLLLFFVNTGCKKNLPKPTNISLHLDTITVAGGNGRGSAANQLNYPAGLFVDSIGNVYVADFSNHRVQKWAPGADSGITVAGGNGKGDASNQLAFPEGIFIDKNGNLFIADFDNGRVQEWMPGADSGITVAGGNGVGSAANQLVNPCGVYIDTSGNLFVSDLANYRIQKFPPNSTASTNGITVAGGNGGGTAANELDLPTGLFVDGSGNIFEAENVNTRVQKFPAGSTSATNGITVASTVNIGLPDDVCVDTVGNIYVTGYNQILKWAPGAANSTVVAGNSNGQYGAAYNELASPSFIFLDAGAKNLYISDGENNRVQKWGLK